MNSQTAYVILGLLSIEGKQSGYDMRRTIQGSVGYFWGESYGQIYPTLRRLTEEGLIAESGRSGKGRGGRREYSLTAAGHAQLREWLAVPYRMDPPRDEFLLKLFFGREAAPGVLIQHVREFQEKNRRVLATIEEIGRLGRERNARHPHFRYWMLTLEYGVAQIRASLQWSEGALKVLQQIESEGRRGVEKRPRGPAKKQGAARKARRTDRAR
ncbi:MAG: PadR family transcriptional regulator [Acidobacteriaceae bacterium]